jgi:hypothetical protein
MKAFISYSHRDETKLERLHAHLAMLRCDRGISEWFDREIKAGSTIDRQISDQLESCQLFLALVSPDFLNSGYCYDKEMMRAIERFEAVCELCGSRYTHRRLGAPRSVLDIHRNLVQVSPNRADSPDCMFQRL